MIHRSISLPNPPPPLLPPPSGLATCLQDTRTGISRNFLKLNSSKTEALITGSKTTLSKVQIAIAKDIIIDGLPVPLSSQVKSLSVSRENILSFAPHIKTSPRQLSSTFAIFPDSANPCLNQALKSWSKSSDHITPILIQLHYLPVQYRINYKNVMLTFKAPHNSAPNLSFWPPPGRHTFSFPAFILCRSSEHSHITPQHHEW